MNRSEFLRRVLLACGLGFLLPKAARGLVWGPRVMTVSTEDGFDRYTDMVWDDGPPVFTKVPTIPTEVHDRVVQLEGEFAASMGSRAKGDFIPLDTSDLDKALRALYDDEAIEHFRITGDEIMDQFYRKG